MSNRIYKIGDIIDNFRNHEECTLLDIDDSGVKLIVLFDNPTENEIRQFKSGQKFEIRFTVLYNIIMFCVKVGNLNWMDAPYNPHLSINMTKFPIPNNNQGLTLQLILINSMTGQIKHMKVIGLSEKFSRELIGTIMDKKIEKFDIKEYDKNLTKIYCTYSTDQIVEMSNSYCCKIN